MMLCILGKELVWVRSSEPPGGDENHMDKPQIPTLSFSKMAVDTSYVSLPGGYLLFSV